MPFRFLLTVLLLSLASCAACPAEARARVLRPDFQTPEETGLSFLAALGCDDPTAEYLCLAESLKEETGATLDGWLLARQDIRQEVGVLLPAAARMLPLATEPWEEGVVVWWSEGESRRFGLKMVEQHYFDLYAQDGRTIGGFLRNPPGQLMERKGAVLKFVLQDPVLRNLDPAEIRRLEVATEWKVAGFLPANAAP